MFSAVRRTAVVVQENTPAVSKQVRCATRVGFWRKRRNLRNPLTRIAKPIMFYEDTRAQSHKMYMKHWMFELAVWREKFREMRMHKVTEYEILNESVPPGRPEAIVRAMRKCLVGAPILENHRLTMRDNPYIKGSQNWMFTTERQESYSDKGKLHYIMTTQGKTLEEAKKIRGDMRGKHRAHTTHIKRTMFGKIVDFKHKGESGVHFEEINKLNTLESEDGAGGSAVTKPRRAWIHFDFDPDSGHKRVQLQPKSNIGTEGLNPLTDLKSFEVSPGGKISAPGSSIVMGTSELPDGFVFPVKVGLI